MSWWVVWLIAIVILMLGYNLGARMTENEMTAKLNEALRLLDRAYHPKEELAEPRPLVQTAPMTLEGGSPPFPHQTDSATL